MQKVLLKVVDQIDRIISKPPSRPIRLMFFDSPILCKFVQNKATEMFRTEEILNLNNFLYSAEFASEETNLNDLENKYGRDSKYFQRKLNEVLCRYIENYITDGNLKKLLILEDSDLFSYEFDPIHFLAAYFFDDGSMVVQKEIPTFWFTIGQKDQYNKNTYSYYKTNETKGREIELKQRTFGSCVMDFLSEY